jgi:hypothetical protein
MGVPLNVFVPPMVWLPDSSVVRRACASSKSALRLDADTG